MPSLDKAMKLEAVKIHVITPMTRLYQPPRHIADNQEAQAEYLRTLADKLVHFPEDVLRKGWEDYKEQAETWTWPSVAKLVGCMAKYSRTAEYSGGGGYMTEREKKERTAEKMVREYLAQRGQAWNAETRSWVREVAAMQAAAINGLAVGYQSMVLKTAQGEPGWSDIRDMMRQAKETGQIHVFIPEWAARQLDASLPTPDRMIEGQASLLG